MSKIIVDEIQKTSGTALTWPSADGTANQVLQTDGSAALSFGTVSAGGKVGQVVSTILTTGASTGSTSATNLTGLAVTITPVATSSKINIVASGFACGASGYGRVYFKLSGGNTATYIGSPGTGHEGAIGITPSERADYSLGCFVMNYLDSPSTTSATTYQVMWWTNTGTVWINRPAVQDQNGLNGVSTITVMEILA